MFERWIFVMGTVANIEIIGNMYIIRVLRACNMKDRTNVAHHDRSVGSWI